jgi:transglutaminase-like putative cysteine protease
MKIYPGILGFLLLQAPFMGIAQIVAVVPKEDVEHANQLKPLYPEDEVVGTSYTESYSFSFKRSNEGTSKVNAQEQVNYEVISLKPHNRFSNAVFYNNESSVEELYGHKGKNQTSVYIDPGDHAYQSGEFFHSDERVKRYSYTLNSSGQKVSFSYTKNYFDIKYFTAIYFHEYFPVENKTVTLEIPNWLQLEVKEMNFEGYDIQKTIVSKGSKTTIVTYTVKNLIGRKNQKHTPGPSHILPHLLIIPKSYSVRKHNEKLLESADDLYNWYHSLVLDVHNDPSVFKRTVDKLIAGKTTDEEKIRSVFYWVQDNIRYIAFEAGLAGYRPAAAQDVFTKRYGDCKGMANLSKEMLKLAGYDARLTWIGTRYIAYDYSTPSLAADNHMICTVFLNGKRIFIDCTESYSGFGAYAYRIQGRPVMIEDGDKYILDRVPERGNEANLTLSNRTIEIRDGNLTGNASLDFNGDAKVELLNGYHNVKTEDKKEAWVRYLADNNKNILISDVKTSDLNNRDTTVTVSYSFGLKNQVIESGNELYLSIDHERAFMKLDFDSTRQFDYEFQYKVLDRNEDQLKIPGGYNVKHFPSPVKKKYDHFSFELSYEEKDGVIYYHKVISIDNGIVKKSEFKDWNTCIADLKRFYMDQIILEKNNK